MSSANRLNTANIPLIISAPIADRLQSYHL